MSLEFYAVAFRCGNPSRSPDDSLLLKTAYMSILSSQPLAFKDTLSSFRTTNLTYIQLFTFTIRSQN